MSDAPKYRMTKNAIMCKRCQETIESTHVHDFRSCACGKVFVDGGLEYARRCGDRNNWVEKSEYEEISDS